MYWHWQYPVLSNYIPWYPQNMNVIPTSPHLCRFKRLLATPNKGTHRTNDVRRLTFDDEELTTHQLSALRKDILIIDLQNSTLRSCEQKKIEDSHMIDVVVSNLYSFTSDNHLKWGGVSQETCPSILKWSTIILEDSWGYPYFRNPPYHLNKLGPALPRALATS